MPTFAFDKFTGAARGVLGNMGALLVEIQAMAGAVPQFNRMAAQPLWQTADFSATGVAFGVPIILGGFKVITAGAFTLTAHDNASAATGKVLLNAESIATVNAPLSPFGAGIVQQPLAGIQLDNGLYLTLSGAGAVRVFYVPQS